MAGSFSKGWQFNCILAVMLLANPPPTLYNTLRQPQHGLEAL
ncbi:hypothetical protein [Pseudomonas sp.]|nr:hypothetical protein [Pseudomonas sp.]